MKKFLFILFISSKGFSQTADSLSSNDTLVSPNILIINSFDAQKINARKNKKELFEQLADSVKQLLFQKVEPTYKEHVIILPGIVDGSNNLDSVIKAVIVQNHASRAIVIRNLDVFFENTGTDVSGEKGNKDIKVSYDICSRITYALYNTEKKVKESEIGLREFYTERGSLSGFLTFGPDIVGKRKDAFRVLTKNVDGLFEIPGLPLFGHNDTRLGYKIKAADTLLKYSISFTHLSQMLYDGSKIKNYINQSFNESGDVSFYRGRYFNARMRYLFATGNVPAAKPAEDPAFSQLINTAPISGEDSASLLLIKMDSSKLKLYTDYTKVFTRTISSIAMLLQTRGNFAAADELLKQALEMRLKWLGNNSLNI